MTRKIPSFHILVRTPKPPADPLPNDPFTTASGSPYLGPVSTPPVPGDFYNPPPTIVGGLRFFFDGTQPPNACINFMGGALVEGQFSGWIVPDTYTVGTDTYSLEQTPPPFSVTEFAATDCSGTATGNMPTLLTKADYSGNENLDVRGTINGFSQLFFTTGITILPLVGERLWYPNVSGSLFSMGGRVLVDRTG